MCALVIMPGYAFAGTMILDSFTDQTTNPINLPATKLLVATVGTSSDKGGNDTPATTVSVGGSVVAADVAEVCVDYNTVQITCVTNPSPLSGISLTLPGNQKGGANFDYRISLNPSAGGKTINLTVTSITNTTLTDNIPLPQTTATVNVAGASAPPSIDTPTFGSVAATSAILGGRVVSVGTSPPADVQGTVWNHTGGSPTENALDEGTAPADTTAFTHTRSGMNSADEVFFRAYVEQSATKYYTSVDSFYTYPANDPTGLNFTGVDTGNITINWTNSSETGNAGGSIVVVSEVSSSFTAPSDGTNYTPDATYPFSSATGGGDDYVVYAGTGTSAIISSLPANTLFYVAVYSTSGLGTSGASGVRYKAPTAATGSQQTNAVVIPTLSSPVLIGGLATVTATSATLGATQDTTGGGTVDARGIVWNTTGSPTIADNTAQLQTGNLANEAFSGAVSPLTAGSQIFFRGYAHNSAGYGYTAADGTVWTEPANQPTGFNTSAITTSSMTISWSDPGGATAFEGAIVVMKEGSDPSEIPADGSNYSANSDWGSAGAIGTAKVVFMGAGNSVDVTGLASGTTYYVRIYEYAGSGSGDTGINYREESPLSGNEATTAAAVPTLSTPVLIGGLGTVTSSNATLGATQLTKGSALVTARGIVWNTTGTPTTADNTAQLQTGADLANEAFSGSVGSLTSATQIFFRGYATSTEGTGYTPTDGTVWAEPANQPSGFGTSAINPTSMTISWSDPGAATAFEGALIVMKTGSDPNVGDEVPVDGVEYAASNAWGSAPAIGAGGAKVIFVGAGNSVNVTGLIASTTYYVRVYEYAGSGSGDTGINYLEEVPLSGNEQTAAIVVPTLSSPVLIGGLTTVAATSATLGATQDTTGGGTVDARGIVWNTTGSPTIADTTVELQNGDLANEAFSGAVSPLTAGTQIFFRGYAHNSAGYGYTAADGIVWTEPANQPTGFGTSAITTSSITISWSDPGGATPSEGAIVVMKAGSDPSEIPTDGSNYSANSDWGSAGAIGTAKVVFAGAGNTVDVTGLASGTTYYVRIYEYAGSGTGDTGINYREETPLSGNETTTVAAVPTLSTPELIGGLITVTATDATLGATQLTWGSALVTARGIVWNTAGTPTTADNTVQLQTGADLANEAFSGGVGSLTSGTQIYFRGYATSTEGTGYTPADGTVWTEPANQPTGISFTAITADSLTINWSDPGGATGAEGAIVVMKEGSDPSIGDEVPVDGNDATSYSPSNAWGGAGTIGAGGAKVVFLGSGNSVSVSGLTPETTYYVRIYEFAGSGTGDTGINYLEGAPLTGSETPTAGVSQATNLWTHNIGSTSMTLFWSEGVGDGSIVVMKQGSAVDATPVDGTEHLADSVFGSGANLGGGNYVVYRGNGESVHVTGLSYPQTYHMAVFTYTGAGALIEYLLPSPAIASEATLENTPHNVAILNIDDTVTCTTGCHGGHGSALVPRGADQETACVSCHHADSGVPGASALTNFSLHTNSKSMPPESPGVVDCGSCHELHNPGGGNTTYTQNPISSLWDYNLHYLRANPQKYVPTALPWPANNLVVHADTNSEDWAFENSAAYQGACQICHTQTSTGYQNTSAGDDHHQGGDLGNVDCRGCHDHGGAFAGAGGDCTQCHNSVKDKDGVGGNPGRRIVTTEFSGGSIVSSHLPGTLDAADCEVCHDQSSHQLGQVKLFDPDGGTSITVGSYIDPRTDATEAAKLTAFCVACHDANGGTAHTTPTSPFTTAGTTVDIQSSIREHTNDGTGSVSCFGDGNFGCHGSGHGGQKLAILSPAESGPGASPDLTDENETFCLNCHDGGTPVLTPAAPDILADLGGSFSASTTTVQADSGAWVNLNHDILPADKDWNEGVDGDGVRPAITCSDCHLPPHDATAASPVKDPDTGSTFPLSTYSPSNSYTDDGHNWSYRDSNADQDPTSPEGGGTHDKTDYVEFCLTCHDGTTPAGITMSNDMMDIAAIYSSDYHGSAPNGGTGTSINRGGMKAPWTTGGDSKNEDPSAPYAALPCTICHGPHGSGNVYNLRASINVAGTQMSTGSWGTGDDMDSIIGTTYIMPPQDPGKPRVWGAWCTFCHQLSAHSYSEVTPCRSGHQHGGGNF